MPAEPEITLATIYHEQLDQGRRLGQLEGWARGIEAHVGTLARRLDLHNGSLQQQSEALGTLQAHNGALTAEISRHAKAISEEHRHAENTERTVLPIVAEHTARHGLEERTWKRAISVISIVIGLGGLAFGGIEHCGKSRAARQAADMRR